MHSDVECKDSHCSVCLDVAPLQGVCKDCGNGTLNNELHPAFHEVDDSGVECNRCGGMHVDIL
jgi:hypothetical protein